MRTFIASYLIIIGIYHVICHNLIKYLVPMTILFLQVKPGYRLAAKALHLL